MAVARWVQRELAVSCKVTPVHKSNDMEVFITEGERDHPRPKVYLVIGQRVTEIPAEKIDEVLVALERAAPLLRGKPHFSFD